MLLLALVGGKFEQIGNSSEFDTLDCPIGKLIGHRIAISKDKYPIVSDLISEGVRYVKVELPQMGLTG
jgi:hypothetical protein